MPDYSSLPPAAQAQITNAMYRLQNNYTPDPQNPYNSVAQQIYSSQDAAAEQAKYMAAFSQPRDDTRVAQSAAFNAITAQYEQSRNQAINSAGIYHQGPVASSINPYDPNTAAGIAWEVGRTGGAVNPGLLSTAIREGYSGPTYLPSISDRSVSGYAIPISQVTSLSQINMGIDTSPTFVSPPASDRLVGGKVLASVLIGDATVTTNVPYGNFSQEKLLGTKTLIDPITGEIAIYQKPAGRNEYMLIGGGSRGAAQSGMFTIGNAETPYVTNQWDIGSFKLPSGQGLSRLGAEAYGGYVLPLDTRTVESTKAQLSTYPSNLQNLANYVNPQGVNLSKAEAIGANIPWSISASSPAIGYMDKNGPTGQAIVIPTSGSGDRLVGGKTVAGGLSTTAISNTSPQPMPNTKNIEGTNISTFFSDVATSIKNAPLLGAIYSLGESVPTQTTKDIAGQEM